MSAAQVSAAQVSAAHVETLRVAAIMLRIIRACRAYVLAEAGWQRRASKGRGREGTSDMLARTTTPVSTHDTSDSTVLQHQGHARMRVPCALAAAGQGSGLGVGARDGRAAGETLCNACAACARPLAAAPAQSTSYARL